jgi:hypothetical protein
MGYLSQFQKRVLVADFCKQHAEKGNPFVWHHFKVVSFSRPTVYRIMIAINEGRDLERKSGVHNRSLSKRQTPYSLVNAINNKVSFRFVPFCQYRALSAASAAKFNISPGRWQHFWPVANVRIVRDKGKRKEIDWDTACRNFKRSISLLFFYKMVLAHFHYKNSVKLNHCFLHLC